MDRFDVLLTGLDPERPRAEVIGAITRRLARSADEIEELLASAPAPLVRATSAEHAQRLVTELRALGARVKPRTEGPELPDAPAAAPIQLLHWSKDEEAEAQEEEEEEGAPSAPSSTAPIDDAVPDAAPAVASAPTEPAATPPAPILVRSASEWFATASLPSVPGATTTSDAPPLDPSPAPPSPARFGRAGNEVRAIPDRPRVFFRALPDALVLPWRAPTGRALALLPALAIVAMVSGVTGLRCDVPLGPLLVALSVTATVGMLGLVHQIAGACLSATASGERKPMPMPGRLMEDYLRLGVLLGLTLATLGILVAMAVTELIALRATMLTLALLASIVSFYGALGLSLSAASQSPLGYLNAAKVLRLVLRSPLRALVVGSIGGAMLGSSVLAALGIVREATTSGSLAVMALDTLVIGPVLALGVGYAAALTATATGLLLHASAAPADASAPGNE